MKRKDTFGLFFDVNRVRMAASNNGVAFTHSTAFIAKKARRKRNVMPGNWTAIWGDKSSQMVYKRIRASIWHEKHCINSGLRMISDKCKVSGKERWLYNGQGR
jgi:hypothetical protein